MFYKGVIEMLTVDDMVSKITEKMLTYFMDGPMGRGCQVWKGYI